MVEFLGRETGTFVVHHKTSNVVQNIHSTDRDKADAGGGYEPVDRVG